MLFTSYVFLLFGSTFFLLYRYTRIDRVWLVNVASLLFYGAWNPFFVLLLLASATIDFNCARGIRRAPERARTYLLVSVTANLAILGFFKYASFAIEAIADLSALLTGSSWSFTGFAIALPVGISFYTFQTMSYTIDVYRGEAEPEDRFRNFLLYVSFFPQLVAGPIERASRILPQIERMQNSARVLDLSGLDLILRGFLKKVLVADNLAIYVDRVFSDLHSFPTPFVVLATFFFALQIYCDFSGYTDIARGLARMMGIELMVNFDYPYFSRNIQEFWARWHISLSTWLRDYLYIPLGGNRGGRFATYRNLMITMVLGGLWHGANYTFLAWGLYHGTLLAVHRAWSAGLGSRIRLPILFSWALTSLCTLGGWYLFRIGSINDVFLLISGPDQAPPRLRELLPSLTQLLMASSFVTWQVWERFGARSRLELASLGWRIRYPVLLALLTAYVLLRPATDQVFIYFQF